MPQAGQQFTDRHRLICQANATRLGGHPEAKRYWDKEKLLWVGMMHAPGPIPKAETFVTFGLSDEPSSSMPGTNGGHGHEFVLLGPVGVSELANVVASSCFMVIRSGFYCAPGETIPEVIRWILPDATVRHVLITTPFGPLSIFDKESLGDEPLGWYQLVPITHDELGLWYEMGGEWLASQLQQLGAGITDIYRDSVAAPPP